MAFLDNSGDIILDAVLTEAGRRRMAEGNFSITKFALGDDEIDYALYNKTHPSGSAYYDLEILQTPVFEAFTQINAGINYGLLPNTATDLLYLPVMKVNELTGVTGGGSGAIQSSGSSGLFVVSDASGDTTADTIASALNTVPAIDFIAGGGSSNNFILVETGLDTGASSTPNGTAANRDSFLVANNLIDTRIMVFYDSRFFSAMRGLANGDTDESKFDNLGASANELQFQVNLVSGVRTTFQSGLENYVSTQLNTIENGVVQPSSGANTEANFSVISGPRGIAAAISPVIKSGLNAEYDLYGGQTTVGGKTVKFIDTTLYVQGKATSAQVQIPVRIMKLA